MNRKILSIIGTVVAIAIVLMLKFVVQPMLEIHNKKTSGQGWTASRSELLTKVKPFMNKVFKGLDLPAHKLKTIGDCIVTKSIAFLNGTDCDYHYNRTTTSKSSHIKKQEKCLKKVGFEKKLELYTVQCAQKHVPNNWKIMHNVIAEEIQKTLKPKIKDSAKRGKVVKCMVEKIISRLEKSPCKPINKEGTTFNTLFTRVVSCYQKHPDVHKKTKEEAQKCMATAMKQPAAK